MKIQVLLSASPILFQKLLRFLLTRNTDLTSPPEVQAGFICLMFILEVGMSLKSRFIISFVVFLTVFWGLMSVVGNVHVAEFYGGLTLGIIAGIFTFFKLPKDIKL